MSSSCFVLETDKTTINNPIMNTINNKGKLLASTEKVMSYEEKSVGSTAFFQCEACPYMAFAEDDIKFHLFTEHPDLAKSNGLADNIQIPCPGCTSIFEAEETLRTHLRSHHKMGIKDVKKMVKSLVQIALKNAKLKKKETKSESPPENPVNAELADVKMPQVIEIVPDIVNTNSDLPKGVAFISVDELNKMSTPNFEKVDPKEIIQEASINIVYTNDISTQYVKLANIDSSSNQCNMIQVSNVTPDLISSIQPHLTSETAKLSPSKDNSDVASQAEHKSPSSEKANPEDKGTMCSVAGCHIRLKTDTKLAYHRKCHQNGKLVCLECGQVMLSAVALHTHLWKVHEVDMDLPTCEICGYKTYKRYRLINIHMKSHKNILSHKCSICSKTFKNWNQLSKHKLIHKKERDPVLCPICQRCFSSENKMQAHVASVHEKLKPFKCPECNYCTARNDELKRHSRLHTGDKPYSCAECNYKTADHNALRRHKKQHSKEAVYQCKYCPYSCIQSTVFTSHMISKHPNISGDIHRCPYCQFKSVNKDKYVLHLTTHTDKEGIQLLIEMTKNKTNKPSWNIPSETVEKPANKSDTQDQNNEQNPKTVNCIPIEVFDCDSISESLPQDYSKNYCTPSTSDNQAIDYNTQVMVTDLSKDDNNSDCVISDTSNNSMISRHQFPTQIPLPMTFEPNLHEYLNTNVSVEQTLLQSSSVNSLPASESSIASSISNNIMGNFPIRLPHVPHISVCNSSTMLSVDKISLPMIKVTGPIIKPTQILPVPSCSNSPVNISNEQDGVPRKKPKISVKSNLILKGPDEENMFHSQQKMAFKRLEDNERFGLRNPVTFNNLITTQFMQLQPEPELSESPSNIMTYPQETMMNNPATTPEDSGLNSEPQIFTFSQQRNNPITLLPPPPKIQTNDPSYIKLETTIKQNTQSPSLERMCNANILNNQAMSREYKASPPLEDIHKNMSVIKNEVKPDSFYNIAMNNNAANSPILDQYLIDNIIGEQYSGHLDLSAVVLPEVSEDDQQNDVIEIDDNSDDNKLLPRFDMNLLPLESFYLMHNDFHFLENEIPANNIQNEVPVNEINRMVTEVPIMNQKENLEGPQENSSNDFPNFIQGKKDPMMNTSVRVRTNKINVKNIELMKN